MQMLAARAHAPGILLIMTAVVGSSVAAAADTPATTDASALQEVIVTGTRAQRTADASLAPVDVFTHEDLLTSAKPDLLDILTQTVPSFSNPPNVIGDVGGGMVQTAKLRGLSPDHTLVLVNGKRRHFSASLNVSGSYGQGSAPADLSLIPASAIDHIEVLRDGASAQYGSDAIAGVINVILRSSAGGGDATLTSGGYFAGDGKTLQTTWSQGLAVGNSGALRLSAAYSYKQPSARTGLNQATLYFAGDPREATANRHNVLTTGDPRKRFYALSANYDQSLTDAVEAYGFATYSHKDVAEYGNFRAPNSDNTVRAIYPNGFSPFEGINEDDFALTAGIKGKSSAWNWDLSSTYGRDYIPIYVWNTNNPTYGTLSSTSFYVGAYGASQWTNNLDVNRSFPLTGLSAPLNVAFGLEQRTDRYQLKEGEYASYADGGVRILDGPNAGKATTPGAQAFPGYRPQDASSTSRNSGAAYVDLETNLTSAWTVGLAGRFEHYSDFGNANSGKFSTRYEFAPAFALRGTVSNGFHAPSLGQQAYAATTQRLTTNTRQLPVNTATAKALGAQPLRPEKSFNYSVGFVLKPVRDLVVTVDAYQISLKDRIQNTGQLTGTGVLNLLAAAGITGITGAQYFANAIDTRTRGLDLVATFTTPLGDWGNINWSAAANINDTTIERIAPTPAQLQSFGLVLFDRTRQYEITKSTPRDKQILTARYSRGKFDLTVRANRYGAVVSPNTNNNPAFDLVIGAKVITDISASYELANRLRLTVGADNVFDVYPDEVPTALKSATWQLYPTLVPYGVGGGNYYARLNYRFN